MSTITISDKPRDLRPQASFFSKISSEGRKRGYLNHTKDRSKALLCVHLVKPSMSMHHVLKGYLIMSGMIREILKCQCFP